jgi:hypothetical protein
MSDKPGRTPLGSDGSDARSAAVVAGVPAHKKRAKTHGPNVQAKPELAGHTDDGEPLIRLPAHDRRMRTQPSLASRDKPGGSGAAAPAASASGRGDVEDPAEKITAKKIVIEPAEKITAKKIAIDPDEKIAAKKLHGDKITERGLGPRTSSSPPPRPPGDVDDDGHAPPSSEVPGSSPGLPISGSTSASTFTPERLPTGGGSAPSDVGPPSSGAISSASLAPPPARDSKGQWLALVAVLAIVAIGSGVMVMRRQGAADTAAASDASGRPAPAPVATADPARGSAGRASVTSASAASPAAQSAASPTDTASPIASGQATAAASAAPAPGDASAKAAASNKRVTPLATKPRPKGRPLIVPIEND